MKIKNLISIATLASFSLLPVSCDFLEEMTEEDNTENNDDNNGNNNGMTNVNVYAQYTFEGNTEPQGQTSTVGVISNTRYVESFNGSKAIEIAPNGLLSFPEAMIDCTDFTISFWIKDCFDGHLFHVKGSDSGYSTCFVLGVENGHLKFVQDGYKTEYRWDEINSYANTTLEGWHHIAIATGNGTGTLYVDGVKTDQCTEPSISSYGTGLKLVFGSNLDRPYLTGDVRTLDNLRIYKAMLSAEGIKNIYKAEAPKGFTPGTGKNTSNVANNALYAYFKMDGNTNNSTRMELIPVTEGISYVDSYNGTKALKISTDGLFTIPEGLIDQKNTSICFWTKNLYDGHVFHAVTTGSYNTGFTLAVTDGHLKFVRDPYYSMDRWGEFSSFINSTLEGWHHIAIVSVGKNKKLYVDGILSDQQIENNVDIHTGYKFVIGGSLEHPNLNATTIIMDNLRVYKHRAITAEEVKAIYNFEK